MVSFVPGFVSSEVVAYGRAVDSLVAVAQRQHPGDSAAVRAELDRWRQTHPRPRATLAQVADHIEHVRKVAGVDHVGVGSDFDGITEVPQGLEDVSKFPALFAELARRGWSDADLRKLAGENVLRAFARAEAVAARLQRERPPSVKTIRELDGGVARASK
jgi:membrane dipeptidase